MATEEPPSSRNLSAWKKLPLIWQIFIGGIGALALVAGLLVSLKTLGLDLPPLSSGGAETSAPPAPIAADNPHPSPSHTDKPDPSTSPAALPTREITEARIEIDERNLIRPNTIEAGQSPGFEPFVFTAAGRLGRTDECYVSWSVFNNSDLVYAKDTRCEKQGGFSEEFWPSDLRVKPGTMRVTADITTGWDATATAEINFTVE